MSEVLMLALSVLVGVALSVPMFAGLWWTLRRLPGTRYPTLFALASFWLRLGVTVLGFYLITVGDWRRGLAALLGFLLGRTLLLRRFGPLRQTPTTGGA